MSRVLVIHARATADVDELAAYLDDRGPDAGMRFLDELEHVFERLRTFPRIGRPWPSENPAISGLRRAVPPTFPVSVFYLPTSTTITVVRVLHQARDTPPLLEDL